MERSGVKNLGGFKREILRCPQNDKKSLLIANLYENSSARDGRPTNTSHFSSFVVSVKK
jgi:hypothetical protein